MLRKASKAHIIQLSTDCVFEGNKLNFAEEDNADSTDIYGRTKYIGKVDCPHSLTIRTSTIGPELK